MLTVVPPPEHSPGAQAWTWDAEDPIQQSLGPISKLTSQAVCVQFCKHQRSLFWLWAQNWWLCQNLVKKVLPASGTQLRRLSVM